MKILTAETVARSTVALLRSLGHEVLDVKEAGLSGSDDSRVAALAVSEHRIIITHDKGFADFLRLRSVMHKGAIVLRLRDPSPSGDSEHAGSVMLGKPDSTELETSAASSSASMVRCSASIRLRNCRRSFESCELLVASCEKAGVRSRPLAHQLLHHLWPVFDNSLPR